MEWFDQQRQDELEREVSRLKRELDDLDYDKRKVDEELARAKRELRDAMDRISSLEQEVSEWRSGGPSV